LDKKKYIIKDKGGEGTQEVKVRAIVMDSGD